MTDIADQANDVAQANLERDLAKAKLPPANDVTECIDCGAPIGKKRKQILPHAVRCVDCAELQQRNRG